jgi:hypothetical protein
MLAFNGGLSMLAFKCWPYLAFLNALLATAPVSLLSDPSGVAGDSIYVISAAEVAWLRWPSIGIASVVVVAPRCAATAMGSILYLGIGEC